MPRFKSRLLAEDSRVLDLSRGISGYAGRKNLLRKGSFLPAPFFFQTFSIDDPRLVSEWVGRWEKVMLMVAVYAEIQKQIAR